MQYGWTLFVNPIDSKYHWGRAGIQVAFSIFVATETWLVPVEGWFVDRFGPRIVVSIGGILVALAWIIDAHANSLPILYIAGAISGVGAGAVYGICVGNALKWFPDRRGLAAGLTAAGFGAGAAISVVPIRDVIQAYGYEAAFQWFGIGQGLVVLVLSQFLVAPASTQIRAASKLRVSARNYTAGEMLRTPVFWIMYLMFVMVAASGLMVTAQVAPIARDYNIANVVLIFGASTLTVVLIVDNVLNGLARPFFGWVSDHVGRENTMAGVFVLGAIAYWLLGTVGNKPAAFVITAGIVYFTWGEIYSLFPATCTDTYGRSVRDDKCGPVIYRQGDRGLAGAACQRSEKLHRNLACRVRGRNHHEPGRRCTGAFRLASSAAPDAGCKRTQCRWGQNTGRPFSNANRVDEYPEAKAPRPRTTMRFAHYEQDLLAAMALGVLLLMRAHPRVDITAIKSALV